MVADLAFDLESNVCWLDITFNKTYIQEPVYNIPRITQRGIKAKANHKQLHCTLRATLFPEKDRWGSNPRHAALYASADT